MEEQSKYELKVDDRRFKESEPQSKDVIPATGNSPVAIMVMALNKGVDIERLEKLLSIQQAWEANEARKAYHEAMAAFKADPPKILKDKRVGYEHKDGGGSTNYSYAGLAQVARVIGQALSKQGLSASWVTKQEGQNITVTCTITHRLGHSESTFLTAAPDASGKKNSIQAVGSTISYLERYTLLALTGLATHDMDDDGNTAGGKEMSKFEEWEIKANEAIETARTVDDLIQWWPNHKETIMKDLKKEKAAKIYTAIVAKKKALETAEKAAEREPGSDDT